MNSMTGFGSYEAEVAPFGRIRAELRSTNHKFLEVVFNLPEGFLSLEAGIKKEIESRLKRGRVLCAINISGGESPSVFINQSLIRQYIVAIKKVNKQLDTPEDIRLDTLINLPGVISFADQEVPKENVWPRLKSVLRRALEELVRTRQKEGLSLSRNLKSRARNLNKHLDFINARFKKAVKNRLKKLATDEERSGFLSEADIAEETERLRFHIRNFLTKFSKHEPVGKELDFIAQEMQREANTMAAKSCDALISSRAVQMKSQLEKIREQLQNIE